MSSTADTPPPLFASSERSCWMSARAAPSCAASCGTCSSEGEKRSALPSASRWGSTAWTCARADGTQHAQQAAERLKTAELAARQLKQKVAVQAQLLRVRVSSP